MKNTAFKLLLALLFISLAACRNTPSATSGVAVESKWSSVRPTVVYVVRHAEKDTLDPANKDPDLTEQGMARGEALKQFLANEQVNGLFATKYIRTQNTLKPLAEVHNLQVNQYKADNFNGLKEQVLQQFRGGTVVVAGHSNTLLPILEAFGVSRPIQKISETEYSYIFKLIVSPDNTAVVEVDYYGEK
ncbi:histidine phosphatase family protein [Pontibacter silvestris]|uniref:Histidine phosphatase family protein n=1 Tax=Pontibacter silvestris TaxID=2305183 RepID=A0ABW4WRC4_9BACT|nr:histidine phosphatase family protein [Pontibacter silvestris]MCC9138582.1 histidine phosphatase family protein [Pontibacter silvestris]